MNYNEFINNIISTRGQWNIPNGEKYNCHHIIPRCKGGLPLVWKHDTIHENLIWLTPEEHYEAHRLLAIENIEDPSIVQAFLMLKAFVSNDVSFDYSKDDEKAFGELMRGLRPWNTGLTKENTPSLLAASKKQRESKLGRRYIHLGDMDKLIKPELLDEYLELGWELGRSDRVKAILKKSSIEAGKKGNKSTWKGKKMPNEAKNKIGKSNSGGVYVYKDNITRHIKLEELDDYLNMGWIKGNLANRTKKGYIWVNNGESSTQINPGKLEKYINLGYTKGRLKYK